MLLPCSFLMQLQCCRESCILGMKKRVQLLPYSMCSTFALISSRPTVATVLVCCLVFFSSFCGLSRRFIRCLITWFRPQRSSREVESAEMCEGDKRRRRVKSSFTVMAALQSLPLILLYSYMFGSQQAAAG